MLLIDDENEVRRILLYPDRPGEDKLALSAEYRSHGNLDFIFAKARLSIAMRPVLGSHH
jgi:hypothetical protein